MVEASGFEILVTAGIILIVGTILQTTGYLADALTVFVFMAMGLAGFLAVRAIQGRRFSWPWE